MERLLGAVEMSQGGKYEDESAVAGKTSVPRGPTFEETSFASNASVSYHF